MRNLYLGLLPVLCLACLGPSGGEPTQTIQDAVAKGDDATDDDSCNDPCANVSCAPGHSCEADCNNNPVCNPDVCEGFAGWTCEPGFTCQLSDATQADPTNPDQGGKCIKDCSGPSCGKCVSSADCGPSEQCSTVLGDCQSWCACPECDVCAGSCVPIADPTCGECISDGDCKEGKICSNQLGDCLGSCSCPACDVCAGHCVAPDASQ